MPSVRGKLLYRNRIPTPTTAQEVQLYNCSNNLQLQVWPEYQLGRLYNTILLRGPDVDGRNFWAERLLFEDDIALAVNLAVSSEFRDRVTEGLD